MHSSLRQSRQVLLRFGDFNAKPKLSSLRYFTSGTYRVPKAFNEHNLHYAPGSPERVELSKKLESLRSRFPLRVPALGSQSIDHEFNGKFTATRMPSEHQTVVTEYAEATEAQVQEAIASALAAKQQWMNMSFHDRASIFLRAAELISGKYRMDLIASTMLGQGKNPWQAEIDAAAELADFFRYNVSFAQEIYDQQPKVNSQGHHGRTDWRPLEGFVYSISPFNFTAIGGNLISAPALMGNVVVWKPAPMTVYPSWLILQILHEAGLPEGVIQLVNGDAELITNTILNHREFSALSFIGSSTVFKSLWAKAATNINKYRDIPRLAGETSGKNFHLLGPKADVADAARHTVRAAFEYAGQKCSACSRVYLAESQSKQFFEELTKEIKRLKIGPPEDLSAFLGPVINKPAFERISQAIDKANKDPDLEKVIGGTYDDSVGYFVDPTVYISKNPDHELLDKELFGPVLTAYVYPDDKFDDVLDAIDRHGGGFALTGNIFSNDQIAIRKAEDRLRYAAGNFYVNCKITAAVIGQQSFGGARASGTCDKAGSAGFLLRFTAPRTLKEEYTKLGEVLYPSNLP